MQLTRRDAVVALGTASVSGGLGFVVADHEQRTLERAGGPVTPGVISRLAVIADVVYPSKVSATEGYIEAYVSRLPEERREATVAGVEAVARTVERTWAESLMSAPNAAIDSTLHRMGVDRVNADPDGTVAERVRFHIVNSLLYLLFTTPKGSRLVGIDNPVGYPGAFVRTKRNHEMKHVYHGE